MSSSPTDSSGRPISSYIKPIQPPFSFYRRQSTLQPPPHPLPGPGYMHTNVHIPMSPPPRHGTLPPTLRPLVLPSPPATPMFLPVPGAGLTLPPSKAEPESPHIRRPGDTVESAKVIAPKAAVTRHSLEIQQTRQMDSIPMFRLSDLRHVDRSAVAQSYNVFESADTPVFVPYSIANMLNEELLDLEMEMESEHESEVESETDMDTDDMEMLPLTPAASVRPSPKMAYGGKQPPPQPITIVDATFHRHDHMGSGSCDMDISPGPIPSSGTLPPGRTHFATLVQSLDTEIAANDTLRGSRWSWLGTPRDTDTPHPPEFLTHDYDEDEKFTTPYRHTPHLGYASSLDTTTSPAASMERDSISTTGTSISPTTNVPAGYGFQQQQPRKRRLSVYRGWWSISSAGRDDQVGRRRESRFKEEMDTSAPEEYFDGNGYEGDDEAGT